MCLPARPVLDFLPLRCLLWRVTHVSQYCTNTPGLVLYQEKQKAAEEEAKRLANMPLPAGWETAVSRSTGQTYYVNTQTGATQYEFPDGPAEVWKVYGASHTYGSKGIRDKPSRRNSI